MFWFAWSDLFDIILQNIFLKKVLNFSFFWKDFLSTYSYVTYFQEVQLAAILFLIFQLLLCYTKLTCLDQLTRY